MSSRVGVLLVGLNGATASTMVAGVAAMKCGFVPLQAGATDDPRFERCELVSPGDFVFGGWDYVGGEVSAAARRHAIAPVPQWLDAGLDLEGLTPRPGLRTALDIPHESVHTQALAVSGVAAGAEQVVADIEAFRLAADVAEVVVVYLGSPSRRLEPRLLEMDVDKLLTLNGGEASSGLIYALGAIQAGASFVDFTPCDTLECGSLHQAAERAGVQLAGRDGSTGQTMMKLQLAALFKLRVRSWYSTNLIGNHDGEILALPAHRETKLADKTEGLADLLGYDDFAHHVTIDYFRPAGDEKEAWDAVELAGWAGGRVAVRVNWRGTDSLLAAPMVIDILRLVVHSQRLGRSGLRTELGFFFKKPLGRSGRSIEQLYDELVAAYAP
jgi:myo-inositol-1-phosphate synthase